MEYISPPSLYFPQYSVLNLQQNVLDEQWTPASCWCSCQPPDASGGRVKYEPACYCCCSLQRLVFVSVPGWAIIVTCPLKTGSVVDLSLNCVAVNRPGRLCVAGQIAHTFKCECQNSPKFSLMQTLCADSLFINEQILPFQRLHSYSFHSVQMFAFRNAGVVDAVNILPCPPAFCNSEQVVLFVKTLQVQDTLFYLNMHFLFLPHC